MAFYSPPGGDRVSVYLEFASIDYRDDSAITTFASRYGLLGLLYRDRDFWTQLGVQVPGAMPGSANMTLTNAPIGPLGARLSLPSGEDMIESVDQVRLEIRRMFDLLGLWRCMASGTLTADLVAESWAALACDMFNQVDDGEAFETYRTNILEQLTSSERVAELAAAVITNRIRMQILGQVTLTVAHEGGQFVKKSRPLTLLSAMYLMLADDLSTEAALERCGNPKCGKYYIAGRSDQRFCSVTCQNQDRQRRYRAKKRQGAV
jgi:hypothetical protein